MAILELTSRSPSSFSQVAFEYANMTAEEAAGCRHFCNEDILSPHDMR